MANDKRVYLRDLIDAACCDALPEEWAGPLERCIRNDPRVRQQYFEAFAQVTTIRFWIKADRAARQAVLAVNLERPRSQKSTRLQVLNFLSSSFPYRGRFKARSMMLVLLSSLIVIGVATMVWMERQSQPIAAPEQLKAVEEGSPFIAKITGHCDAVWNETNGESLAIESLVEGQRLSLLRGSLELAFASGATMLVEGPASFQIDSSNGGSLSEGRVVAIIPTKAKGFCIRTPAIAIVDLGTEFGVEVNSQGKAEVHVLKGVVEVSPTKNDRSEQRVRLTAGHAVQASVGHVELTKVRIDRERFEQVARTFHADVTPPQVLAHYRLGEDDDNSQPTLTLPQIGAMPLQSAFPIHYQADAAPGVSHRAVFFSVRAKDYLESTSLLLETADKWVLEAWVRPRSNKNAIVVFNGRPADDGFGLMLIDGKWVGALGHGAYGVAEQSSCIVGEWTHLALVQQQNRGTSLWVQGVRAEIKFKEGLSLPDMERFSIGGCSATDEFAFDGEIDEVRWSRIVDHFQPSILLRKRND